jgi:hypothetical protein
VRLPLILVWAFVGSAVLGGLLLGSVMLYDTAIGVPPPSGGEEQMNERFLTVILLYTTAASIGAVLGTRLMARLGGPSPCQLDEVELNSAPIGKFRLRSLLVFPAAVVGGAVLGVLLLGSVMLYDTTIGIRWPSAGDQQMRARALTLLVMYTVAVSIGSVLGSRLMSRLASSDCNGPGRRGAGAARV